MPLVQTAPVTSAPAGLGRRWRDGLRWALLAASAVLFALHFLHLTADFPNNSPWMDWSKYTDEGWYGDAAIRHYMTGHWYWKGDFNPAVALPVWPAIEWVVFRFTGVSPTAARALTLCVFAVTLVALYRLLDRFTAALPDRRRRPRQPISLAPALAVFFLCASPFFYVFERMAILEPLVVALMLLAFLAASSLRPWPSRFERPRQWLAALWPACALGVLLTAMILTKTTAVALIPAVAYLAWYRAGYRLLPAVRLFAPPLALAILLWAAYLFGFVRPHYLEDYHYLFTANNSTFQAQPLATVLSSTFSAGMWMGKVLYPAFFVLLAIAIFARPGLFRNPILSALLLWVAGYFAFLAYHNNPQPRYYLVPAVPITALVALLLEALTRSPRSPRGRLLATAVSSAVALAIVLPDLALQADFIRHPEYTFQNAVQSIARIVRSDRTHSNLILSISGSDITLMTGLPSINDDFGTLELGDRVKQYHPGWFVAWNELDDDKMDSLAGYDVTRVAAFPSMDDPERNLLILYRLDPSSPAEPPRRHRGRRTPTPLRPRLGQQPMQQVEH